MIASPKIRMAVLTAMATLAAASVANAGTLSVLYAFRGFPAGDGANPHAAPILDDKGDLYGTAGAGGSGGCGIVYKLHKIRSGAWKESILYSFACGDDGYAPEGGVIMDKNGKLAARSSAARASASFSAGASAAGLCTN